MKIVLPFPDAILAGHAKGNGQWQKIKVTKEHRALAKAEAETVLDKSVFDDGEAAADIPLTIRFIPPNKRGDRMNYPARMKPYVDGIADALGVNDRRFHPCFIYCEPEKPGCVEVYIGAAQGSCTVSKHRQPSEYAATAVENKVAGASATNPRTGHRHKAIREPLP